MKKMWPLLVIFFVWFLFIIPVFRGNVPFPSKYLVTFFSPWSAYPKFATPVKNESMPDVIGQIYPWKAFTVSAFKDFSVPLWNPYSFSGTPHLANYQSAVLSPFNLGFLLFPIVSWWTILILLQPLLAGICTYLYIRCLKLSIQSCLMGAISFMFCGFITAWMGYGTLGYAITFLPLALYAIEKYYQHFKDRYLVLFSITLPLSFFSGHFQISLYFFLFVGLYLVLKFFQTKNISASLCTIGSLMCGVLLCAPQLLPTIELYSQSFRSTIFTKTEVIPWAYLPTFFSPDFFGNPVTRNAWFGHYAEWNAYIGLIPLFFVFYALLGIRRSYVLFFTIAGVFSILLAFDSPLLSFLVFLKVPVLSTSAASRIIVLFSFSAAVLSSFGLEILQVDTKRRNFWKIVITFLCFSFCLGVLWAIALFHLFLTPAQASIAKSNLRLTTAFCLGLGFVLIGFIFFRRVRVRMILVSVLIVLVAVDMLRFANKWMPFDPKALMYPDVGVISFFPQIRGVDRVYMNAGAEDSVYYHLPGIEGYDAVYIRRYGEFIASLSDGRLQDSFRSVVAFPKNGKDSLAGANLLGIRYIVHKISDGQNVWEFPFWKYDPKSVKLLFDDHYYQVLENTNAYPRAFLVNKLIVETNPQKILDSMFSPATNLRTTAVVEENLGGIAPLGSGSAQFISYKPNKIVIKTSSQKESFLVLTDSYYPGWNAYIDGVKTQIYRADFAFRGVLTPTGSHIVEFRYEPKSFPYGIVLAIIGVVSLMFLTIINKRVKLRR